MDEEMRKQLVQAALYLGIQLLFVNVLALATPPRQPGALLKLSLELLLRRYVPVAAGPGTGTGPHLQGGLSYTCQSVSPVRLVATCTMNVYARVLQRVTPRSTRLNYYGPRDVNTHNQYKGYSAPVEVPPWCSCMLSSI